MFHHILLVTKTFPSLLSSPSSGYIYKSTQKTKNCQIVSVEPLNVMTDVSDCPYGHKMSAYRYIIKNR